MPDGDVLGLRYQRGIADLFRSPDVGRGNLVLDNGLGHYSTSVTSPFRLKPGDYWTFKAITSTGSIYSLFAGNATKYTSSPDPRRRVTDVELQDRGRLLERDVSIPMAVNINVGSVATSILSAAQFGPGYVSIDKLDESSPFILRDLSPGTDLLHEVLRAGLHWGYVDGRGRFVLKNRNTDAFLSPVASHAEFLAFRSVLAPDRIVNDLKISGTPAEMSTTVSSVAYITQAAQISSGQTLTMALEFLDPETLQKPSPVVSLQTPVASTDYTFTSFSGTDISSDLIVSVVAFANSALVELINVSGVDGVLQRFQLRGNHIRKLPVFQITAVDQNSQDEYGILPLEFNNDLVPKILHNTDYATFLLNTLSQPRDRLSIGLKNVFPDIIQREIGERVTVVNTFTGVSSTFQIIGMEHSILMNRGHEHSVTYEVEVSPERNWFVLDADRLDTTDGHLAF